MHPSRPLPLKEVQLRLGVPQHVLIHLCEKGVVEPDFAETTGRGKRREFSERNVFEFAVALALRDLEQSVATAAIVLRLLRRFEVAAQKGLPDFGFVKALGKDGLEMKLFIHDGEWVVLAVSGPHLSRPLVLRAPLSGEAAASKSPKVERLEQVPGDFDARLEVNLARIAARVAR